MSHTNIEVITNSVVAGRYDDNWIMIHQRSIGHVSERLDQGQSENARRRRRDHRTAICLRR